MSRADNYAMNLAEERLILDATELIEEMLDHAQVTRAQLAEKLGTSKSHVTQLLDGKRNMTLRTLAEIAYHLGEQIVLSTVPERTRDEVEEDLGWDLAEPKWKDEE